MAAYDAATMHTPTPPLFSLHGKRGLVLGLADANSIAYGCARVARAAGAQLVLSCVNDKARAAVQPLADQLESPLVVCNVEAEGALDTLVQNAHAQMGGLDFVVHSIAWAPLADLHGRVVDSSTEGFARAMEISCHSFARLARSCEPLMPEGGSLITMSYLGSQQAVEHYGMMGPVKAALESLVRYMALELGPRKIRVYAVSPGPVASALLADWPADKLAEAIEVFGPVMLQIYGQAEVPGAISVLRIEDHFIDGQVAPRQRLLSAGRRFPFTRVAIMGDDGQVLTKPGAVGEIVAHGDIVTTGFL